MAATFLPPIPAFPVPAIPALTDAVKPFADKLGLASLPYHIHEVLAAALLYTFVQLVVSPVLSNALVPHIYKPLSRGKRASWDSHVVSLVQSVLINLLALWCMFSDKERYAMKASWEERIFGYTPTCAMVQSMAAGYFLWDLILTVSYLDVFGLGLLAHATSALTVYSFGYRPFLNFYAPNFILYELSTPFLNFHWFFDKLSMTGSKAQLYNGIVLIATFFGCRLIYGNYQSFWVYSDMWNGLHHGPGEYLHNATAAATAPAPVLLPSGEATTVMAFNAESGPIPLWLFVTYAASNLTLNFLNVFWFFKMISAVRKRFTPLPEGTPVIVKDKVAVAVAAIDDKSPVGPTVVTGSLATDGAADELRHRGVKELLTEVEDDLTEIQ